MGINWPVPFISTFISSNQCLSADLIACGAAGRSSCWLPAGTAQGGSAARARLMLSPRFCPFVCGQGTVPRVPVGLGGVPHPNHQPPTPPLPAALNPLLWFCPFICGQRVVPRALNSGSGKGAPPQHWPRPIASPPRVVSPTHSTPSARSFLDPRVRVRRPKEHSARKSNTATVF